MPTLKELEDEVLDCEKSVEDDTKSVEDAKKWLYKSKLRLAEAIIALDNFKKGL